jgi:hypothetical protein
VGNIDFTNHAGFSWYCLLLMFTGIAMLVITLVRGQTRGGKILNLVFGAGFLIYGLYLTFLFSGGTYIIFFKAFILPALLIVNTIRSAARRRAIARRQAAPAQYQSPDLNQMPAPPDQYQPPYRL